MTSGGRILKYNIRYTYFTTTCVTRNLQRLALHVFYNDCVTRVLRRLAIHVFYIYIYMTWGACTLQFDLRLHAVYNTTSGYTYFTIFFGVHVFYNMSCGTVLTATLSTFQLHVNMSVKEGITINVYYIGCDMVMKTVL